MTGGSIGNLGDSGLMLFTGLKFIVIIGLSILIVRRVCYGIFWKEKTINFENIQKEIQNILHQNTNKRKELEDIENKMKDEREYINKLLAEINW